MLHKPLYISCEGIDGTGKTTLTRDISLKLGMQLTRMPGGSSFAEEHRAACRNADISDPTQILFYAALNIDTNQKVIQPALSSGNSIISDRGFGSTYAYQTYASGYEDLLLNILTNSGPLAIPDLTIYLDIDMKVAFEREMGQDRVDVEDRYSRMEIVQKEIIKEAYDKMYIRQTRTSHIEESPERMVSTWKLRERLTKQIAVVDANQPYEQVLSDCITTIENHRAKTL